MADIYVTSCILKGFEFIFGTFLFIWLRCYNESLVSIDVWTEGIDKAYFTIIIIGAFGIVFTPLLIAIILTGGITYIRNTYLEVIVTAVGSVSFVSIAVLAFDAYGDRNWDYNWSYYWTVNFVFVIISGLQGIAYGIDAVVSYQLVELERYPPK